MHIDCEFPPTAIVNSEFNPYIELPDDSLTTYFLFMSNNAIFLTTVLGDV